MSVLRFAIPMLLLSQATFSQVPISGDPQSRTVLGPSNIDLADGAAALKAGDAEEGVMLTQRGLRSASNERDRVAAYSNLCAGFIMLDRLDDALDSCDSALAIDDRHWRSYSNRALVLIKMKRYPEAQRDLERGEAINPNARTLKIVKSMYLDAVDPVTPSIIIDDRRQGSGEND